tara:strand:- start:600 stop:788 length:189 start_codon:yes stop_codon:yes gene_type:complete
MWLLLVALIWTDASGNDHQERGQHHEAFLSAEACYTAAADLFANADDKVKLISIACVFEEGA